MDYAFLTKMGHIVKEGEECWNDPDTLKMLIVKDALSKSVFAHAVPKKGVDEKRFAVDMVVRDCLWRGYSKMLLKSDNEPAIVALLKQALASLKIEGLEQVGEEHSPPYDSEGEDSDVETMSGEKNQEAHPAESSYYALARSACSSSSSLSAQWIRWEDAIRACEVAPFPWPIAMFR